MLKLNLVGLRPLLKICSWPKWVQKFLKNLKDTATSPIKSSNEYMEVDKGVRKRLALEGSGLEEIPSGAALAITEGKGEEEEQASPVSSANSKKAKTGDDG